MPIEYLEKIFVGYPHHLEWLESVTKILSLGMTIFGLKMMVKVV